jgi:membrane fusion protein, multidrug efflux system
MLKSPRFIVRKIYLFLFISTSACCFFISCGNGKKSDAPQNGAAGAKPPTLTVDALVIAGESISADIEVPGTILPNETTEIHPEVSGRVVQLNLREGGFVTKGALLAKLYDGDLQAQLKKLQVQLKIAEQTEDRQSQLLKIQGISQQDYDLSLLQVNNIKADMEIMRTSISKTEIRAPFSGKLGLKNISPGAYITPATNITSISQVSQLKLQFTVPERYSAQIKNGQSIQFTIDGSSKIFTANVSAAEVAIEETSRSLAVRSIIKGQDALLIPGAFAKVKIVLGKNEEAMMIPTGSVIPQGRKKMIFVFNGGRAKSVDITTGVRDSSRVQVLSGLNFGDTVITSGILYLKQGSDVKIGKINNPQTP